MKKPLPIGLRKQQRNAAAGKATVEGVADNKARASRSFALVGLGASAGGLEALEQFLGNVPKDSGLGFVVVQHLDPTRQGILVELLQRKTTMPVVQITDRMRMEPDRVYIIPPNKDLSLLHGVLHLLEPVAPRGLRLPIDFFFRSMAADRQEQSVGVILSGMGSDGALGLRAIKEKAGAGFVQSPDSAKFDSMPRAAIEGGLADIVAPADELPAKIINYLRHFPVVVRRDHHLTEKDRGSLEKIVILLRAQTGHDFSLYKKNTISRRIERRMGLHQITDIADYARYWRENSQEAELLFKELLIGVTSFFRDPLVWEQLAATIIPDFLATRATAGTLRAWTAACSTGEEAYSLAIILKEALERTKKAKSISFQIFATDLDKDAIQKARAGTYPANISADVSDKRLDRFFVQNKNGSYTVKSELRELVVFAPQNLVMQPPFTKLDIVICRNLLIYLEAELQQKLIPLFHYSLRPGGILLLGSPKPWGPPPTFLPPCRSSRESTAASTPRRKPAPSTFRPNSRAPLSITASSRSHLPTLPPFWRFNPKRINYSFNAIPPLPCW
jgi:two-component system CheB/CheR fusion protein